MNDAQFTFLMCSERAGSNLITRIFDAHPSICGPSPSHLFEILTENLWRYGDLDIDANWQRLVGDAVDILNTKIGVWQTTTTIDELLYTVPSRSLAALTRYVFQKEAEANDKPTLFIKERRPYRFTALLLSAFPNAKYVYLVRDPRDVALSWHHARWRYGGLKEGCQAWKEDQVQGMHLYSWLKEHNKMVLIRYEDLLQNPASELDRVCRFLNLDYDPAMPLFSCEFLNETKCLCQ